jgi:hypothetical protein
MYGSSYLITSVIQIVNIGRKTLLAHIKVVGTRNALTHEIRKQIVVSGL